VGTRFLALAFAAGLCGCSYGQLQLGTIGVAAVIDGRDPMASSTPPLDPARRVKAQDCSRPIEDPSANLKCR